LKKNVFGNFFGKKEVLQRQQQSAAGCAQLPVILKGAAH
jgi:hypothetical protein